VRRSQRSTAGETDVSAHDRHRMCDGARSGWLALTLTLSLILQALVGV
jgi:hypothetical protein